MTTKVYLLLELVNGKRTAVATKLEGMPGVCAIDILEGKPDLMTVIEAPERQKAAEYLMEVLSIVDGAIEDIRVMPVCEAPVKT
jgi:hypothetical protein